MYRINYKDDSRRWKKCLDSIAFYKEVCSMYKKKSSRLMSCLISQKFFSKYILLFSKVKWLSELKWCSLNALSFYGSKMILERPKHFEQVQFVLFRSKLLKNCPEIYIKPKPENWIGHRPKQIGLNQNNLHRSKTI